jgi:hypothetical protein
MRSKRFAQRCSSEIGSVLPFVAAGMGVLLLFLLLVIDSGVVYVGRTQLQQRVDAAARAAMLELSRVGSTRASAEQEANEVADKNSLMQDGITPTTLKVEFGKYIFSGEKPGFTPNTDPMMTPQAVKVSINKSGGQAFRSLLTGAEINVSAESVAALRCRNIVFVQDVSSSFKEDIGKIQAALRATVDLLASQESFNAVGTRVGLVAFRNIVPAGGTTGKLLAPDDPALRAAIEALSDPRILCDRELDRINMTVPRCVGSNMLAALQETERLLAPGNGRLEACEDLVLTISDGVPCKIDQSDLAFGFTFAREPASEPAGGGSTRDETLAFVNRSMRATRSIAVLTTNTGTPGGGGITESFDNFLRECPETRGQGREIDVEFANKLVSGFGQSLESDLSPSELAEQMDAAMRSIPPVIVPSINASED